MGIDDDSPLTQAACWASAGCMTSLTLQMNQIKTRLRHLSNLCDISVSSIFDSRSVNTAIFEHKKSFVASQHVSMAWVIYVTKFETCPKCNKAVETFKKN